MIKKVNFIYNNIYKMNEHLNNSKSEIQKIKSYKTIFYEKLYWILKIENKIVIKAAAFLKERGFKESRPDDNGLFDGYIVPLDQAKFLFYISFLCIPSFAYALYRRHYDMAIVPFGVWLTSMNYWRCPKFSWRRNLDIAYVFLSMFYQIFRAYSAENGKLFYLLLIFGSINYPISWRLQSRCSWLSLLFHLFIHLVGNISNIILYSGYIKPINSYFN